MAGSGNTLGKKADGDPCWASLGRVERMLLFDKETADHGTVFWPPPPFG